MSFLEIKKSFPSLSSAEPPSSSSEEMEDADCYAGGAEAEAALASAIWRCEQAGSVPDFRLDKRKCVVGECAPQPSSSSGEGGDGVCAVSAKSLLRKEAEAGDGWTYLGRESYGSRPSGRVSFKPGTRFFDALGRAYDRMKARIMYYVFRDAVEPGIPLEFEVWGKVVRDGDGNDVRVFVKEDKARGLRRDSSFYWDGSWEVFEFDESANETRFKASSGISSLRKYDDRKRLTKRYMIDTNGDTLTSERYEWENGRLVRMTANGVVRNYIYGKTLQDTVKVIPSDEGFNYHSGYDGTAGKMPEEGDPGYWIFAMEPYGHVYFGNEGDEPSDGYFALKSYKPLNVLAKSVTRGCVSEEAGMPRAQCIRLNRRDIPDSANTRYGYSHRSNGNFIVYGHSDFNLSLNYECKCDASGKYKPSFSGKTVNEILEVIQSVWRYDDPTNDWHEYCWTRDDWQSTYAHEVLHIKNGREKASDMPKLALIIAYDTKEQCERYVKEKEHGYLNMKWDEWYVQEQMHKNPNSPSSYGFRGNEVYCD